MELKDTHYVYALLDALDCEVYIGKTSNPKVRLATHHSCPSGWPMREAVHHGCKFRMRILSEHSSSQEALDEEARQIAARKGTLLLNTAQNYEQNPRTSIHGPETETSRFWEKALKESGWHPAFWD